MRSGIPEDRVTVLVTGDQGVVAVAKSILESADIPCFIVGEETQNLSGINLPLEFVEIQVAAADEAEAKDLLQHL
ncbi:DUF2007 domain-containing protein [Candidatus Bipolaricaulota bacterium]|nr:DUF2007 domain-containing protein [Candidatus Bipolaricaulota bacterium]